MCLGSRVLLFSLLGLLVAPALVHAEPVDALLRKGVQLRKEGKDQEAFQVFEQAVAVQKTPRTVAQLALSEQALGLWTTAEAHLTEALDAKDDVWVQKNRPPLEKSLRTIPRSPRKRGNLGDPGVRRGPLERDLSREATRHRVGSGRSRARDLHGPRRRIPGRHGKHRRTERRCAARTRGAGGGAPGPSTGGARSGVERAAAELR